MSHLLEMTGQEIDRLVWIHSNKFIIPELFRKKFHPQGTYRNACYTLSKYVQKGFLQFEKPDMFAHNFYFLTVAAIKTLDDLGAAPIRTLGHPIHINRHEREHDLMVQELRIALEDAPELEDIFWVSDFEMRAGISPEIKVEYFRGELREGWRKRSWERAKSLFRRTPDGYFEADFRGERQAFVLEFEKTAYNWNMIRRMVYNLDSAFPYALRLVVSETEPHAIRMVRNLRAFVREKDLAQWFVTDFKRLTTLPFEKCWHQLDEPVEE